MEIGLKKEEKKVLVQRDVNRLAGNPLLDSWEKEFLESIRQQITSRDLTEKQMNALDKIKKKCART